jgi:type VI secretion system secreted protein Hcp
MALYLKWGNGPDIKGEVTESKHEKWIAIDSATFKVTRAETVEVGSGQEKRHRNPPSFGTVTCARTYDASSPLLFNAACSGDPTNVLIHFVEPPAGQDKPANVYLILALRACIISMYEMGGGTGGPAERLALSYTGIKMTYTPYDETDKAKPMTRGFFDLITGKCTEWK